MKYKLIATDMDGTLLNSRSELSDRTRDAVLRAVESRALFVASSGRPMLGLEGINSLLDRDMPFIVFNGASCVMGKTREVLFDRFLDIELAREVFDIGNSRGIPMIIWTNRRLRASRKCKETDFYKGYYNIEMDYIERIAGFGEEEGVYKLIWIVPPATSVNVQNEMNAYFGGKLNCFLSQAHYLEFVNCGADKGSALGEIGKRFDIDRSEMIAVGDGYNDIPMLRYAGLGVAMSNAADDIKAVCDYVTLSNDEDGVAAVIDEYILGKD